jgi:4-hydroxy-tetrahydrodipicolinate reductase
MEELGKSFNPLQVEEHETLAGCRGGQRDSGLRLHSIRLPGLVAHQEVMFGAPGETYTLRHDTIDRSAYMPGVLLTVRKVRQLAGLVYGLERLL